MAITNWAGLQKAAKRCYEDGIICLATREIVERSNREPVLEPLRATDAGLAARILVDSALTRLHIFLCRAFARSHKSDDMHLRAAVDFLRTPGAMAGVTGEQAQD